MSTLAAFTLLVLLLALLITGHQAVLSVETQNQQYISNLSSQLNQTIQSNFNSLTKIMRLISFNNDVQSFLLLDNESERYASYSRLKRYLGDFSTLNSGILDIVIVDGKNRHYRLSDNILYEIPAMELSENAIAVSSLEKMDRPVDTINYLILGKNIYSIDSYNQTNQWIGDLYIIVSPETFTGSEADVNFKGDTCLILTDREKNNLWSNTTSDVLRRLQLQSDTPGLYQMFLEPQGFYILAYNDSMDGFLRELNWKDGFPVYLLILVLALVLLWIFWVRNFVKPLSLLTGFLETVKRSDLNGLKSRIHLTGYQEISVISDEVNDMFQQIHDLTQELITKNAALYETELLAKQSELMHLRSQINPHFLYNTLDTMIGIAYGEGQTEIAKIAEALAMIFKYSIKGADMVPLKDELKIAQSYVVIQRARFENRFGAVYQIDEDCLSLKVPKMILQPLIENAIVHGIEPAEKFCHLTIGARKEDCTLILTIDDDGCGIEEATLATLQEFLSKAVDNSASSNSHIGLKNVHNRIRIMYGEKFGLQIVRKPDSGTQVKLLLPLIQ